MLSVTFVVGILFTALMAESSKLQGKIQECQSKMEEISVQIDEEEKRTEEIDELKEYMKTDEYAEEVARDKLGLVKGNEIVFKEEE